MQRLRNPPTVRHSLAEKALRTSIVARRYEYLVNQNMDAPPKAPDMLTATTPREESVPFRRGV